MDTELAARLQILERRLIGVADGADGPAQHSAVA